MSHLPTDDPAWLDADDELCECGAPAWRCVCFDEMESQTMTCSLCRGNRQIYLAGEGNVSCPKCGGVDTKPSRTAEVQAQQYFARVMDRIGDVTLVDVADVPAGQTDD